MGDPDHLGRVRRKRLLTAILAVIGGMAVTATTYDVWTAVTTGARLTVDLALYIGVVVALIASFHLNRRGRYDIAAPLAVWTAELGIFASAIPSPSLGDLGILYFLVIPLLLASILLQLRGVVALTAASAVGIVAFAVALGPNENLPLFTVLIISAATLLATFYRDRLERDRRRTLEESEERLRWMIAHAPEAILLFEGGVDRVVEANDRALELFGGTRAELLGRGFRDHATAADPANAPTVGALAEGITRALAGEEPVFDLEFTRDGAGTAAETRLVRLPAAGRGLVRASFIDVTDRRHTESRLRFLATHDILTQLPNRDLYDERLSAALSRARRQGQQLAVVFLDIDDFKTVNDALGHAQGDQLLREVSTRLRGCLRESDTVARRGGDEFSLLLENVTGSVGAVPILWKLLTTLSAPYHIGGREIFVTVSLGVAVYPDDGEEAAQLLHNADTALYQAKADGKSTYRFFTSGMAQPSIDRLSLASRLRHALDRQELFLCYQPQVQASTGRVLGFEALLRWRTEEMVVSPGVFIPVAEETGLIVEIGSWALRTACAHLARLHAAGHGELTISVNLSGRQLRHGSLIPQINEALGRAGLPADRLLLELTENILFQEGSLEVLGRIRETGARLAVDDFGTGYTTLWQLPRLPLEELKIDKRFADGITARTHDDAIVGGIVGIGKRLGLRVVAEGVEDIAQLERFVSHGCDVIQGYYYSRPCPDSECSQLLAPGRFAPVHHPAGDP